MVKQVLTFAVTLAVMLVMSGCAVEIEKQATALKLEGFKLINPRTRLIEQGTLLLAEGRIVSSIPQGTKIRVVKGEGRWLLPAFQDLFKAMWGNPSTLHYSKLYQGTNPTVNLQMNLFCGVAYTVSGFRGQKWRNKAMKRIEAFGLQLADLGFTGKGLIGGKEDIFYGRRVNSVKDVSPTVKMLAEEDVAYLLIYFGEFKDPFTPAVTLPVMQKAVKEAKKRGLKSVVVAWNEWHIREAVNAGADAIMGISGVPIKSSLYHEMARRGTRLILTHASQFDFQALASGEPVLEAEMATDTIAPAVIASYADENKYDDGNKALLEMIRKSRKGVDANMKSLVREGVPLIGASSAGFGTAAFQGYTMHRYLVWLHALGMDPWIAIRAVTTEPADFVGRPVGFRVGDLADFFAVDADPLKDPENSQKISLLIHRGQVLDREKLKPDLLRTKY